MPSLVASNSSTTQSNNDSRIAIDVTTLPGYQAVPENCPLWKRGLIEKKNSQLLERATIELEERLAEEERWKDVPAWKKTLILEKERKMRESDGLTEEERREREEDARRLEAMPEWKRKLVLQKRSEAQKNEDN